MLKVARFLRWSPALATAVLVLSSFERTSLALDNVPPDPSKQTKEASKTGFSPFVLAGGAVRIDDAPLFNITERVGGNFGIGFLYQIKSISFGLSYEHSGIGREDSGVGPYGFVTIDRKLDVVLASVKVNFSGVSWVKPYLGVSVGGVWQDANAKGVVLLDQGVSGSANFGCNGSDSANLALRFGGGVQVPMSPNVSFITDVAFDAYRLSSDIIQFCAPGAGATSAFLFRFGFAYHFDMAESPRPRPRPPS
jgi:opacity protein-like surface antigen